MAERQGIVAEIHKPARKNFLRRRMVTKFVDDCWEADLIMMQEPPGINKGYKYILTVIDRFSKFAWSVPLRSKFGLEVTKAMRGIFTSSNRSPKNLQSDDGTEFFNIHFQKLMSEFGINHYSSFSVMKAATVERFNRTLKTWLWPEFHLRGSRKWYDILSRIMDRYNSKIHRTIGVAPNRVTKSVERDLIRRKVFLINDTAASSKPKFRIGDVVRISRQKGFFEKGYTPNWTTELFTVNTIKSTNPITYTLQDYRKQDIQGSFYEQELLKTKYKDTYLVERVVRKNKSGDLLVKWLGFDSTHNSWVKPFAIY